MNDRELGTKVQEALDKKLSGLKDDPWLAQRIQNCADGEEPEMKKKLSFSIVFVIAAVLALGTALAAAIHTDFFSHVFGNETRESVEVHTEQFDNGKGGKYEHLYPAREYTAADPELAERLVGSRVAEGPVMQMGDYTLTVLSAVRDENAMVMELTLECPTGVKGLNYDRLTNEGKGAWFADDAPYFFTVENAAEMMYVDIAGSTDTCVRIYYYCVFFRRLPDGEAPMLTAAVVTAGIGEEDRVFDPQEAVIPATKAVAVRRFTSADGGVIELSPFSMKVIPAGNGPETVAVAPESGTEPAIVLVQDGPESLADIRVKLAGGEEYIVREAQKTDNTLYQCGGLGESFRETSMLLNRLVDPEAAERILADGAEYLPERKND